MMRRPANHKRAIQGAQFRVLCLAAFTLAAGIGSAHAQYMVPQNGRLFEVNPMIGGGGYNYSRPASPLMSGNAYATGNVGRGLSLQSYSPISSPTAFRADLGSGALSNFIRDSISPADANIAGAGLIAAPFYDPVRTAPSVGYLQGQYNFRPATPDQNFGGQWSNAGAAPDARVLPYGVPPALSSPYDAMDRQRMQTLGQPLNNTLSSSIFGVPAPQPPSIMDNAITLPNANYVPNITFDVWGMPKEAKPGDESTQETLDNTAALPSERVAQPLDLRITPSTALHAQTPIDTALRPAMPGTPAEPAAGLPQPGVFPTQPGVVLAQPGTQNLPGATSWRLDPQAQFGAAVHPGGDVFADMQMALELSQNPQADWFQAMQDSVGMSQDGQSASPTAAMDRQAHAVDAAAEFLTSVFENPLVSFAGSDPTAVNQEIRQAEAAMDVGRYYDAIRYYDRAAAIAPGNPLPMIGLGHAYLAAGEYVSAAANLISGLERFPNLSRFQVDLPALMGGGEIVDVRRADLMKMLERREDPQLRFLLGYLELNSGMAESGLQNLEKAADDAPTGSVIRRYPDLVRYKVYTAPQRSGASIPTPDAANPGAIPTTPASEKQGDHP